MIEQDFIMLIINCKKYIKKYILTVVIKQFYKKRFHFLEKNGIMWMDDYKKCDEYIFRKI
jgi:hypothetical protein